MQLRFSAPAPFLGTTLKLLEVEVQKRMLRKIIVHHGKHPHPLNNLLVKQRSTFILYYNLRCR